MPRQETGIIYLSDKRAHLQTEIFRSLKIFQKTGPLKTIWPGFGSLQEFNDDTLAGISEYSGQNQPDTLQILLPLVGGIIWKSQAKEEILEPGELLIALTESEYEIRNPHEEALVNYLDIRLSSSSGGLGLNPGKTSFDLDQTLNTLIPVWKASGLSLSLGKFGGRVSGNYKLKIHDHGVFAFVISGAFEVQDRLLHVRDALSLSNAEMLDFECLSEEGILLLLEVDRKDR